MWLRKPTLLQFKQKRILTQSTKQRNHKHQKQQSLPQKNKPDTLNLIDKSRYTIRNNLSNKSTRIEKPTEIDILKDNENVSLLSVQGDDLNILTIDNICITHKNKRKENPDTSVIRNEPFVEPLNPSKR